MKKFLSYSLLAAAAAAGVSLADTATTTPVGYTTTTLPSGATTLMGTTLHSPVLASGVITGETSASISDSAVNFGTLLTAGSTYVLEIEGGVIQEVTAWSGSTLTTQDVTSYVTPNTTKYKLRKAATIASVFGATNSAGLTATATGNAGTYDQVMVLNAAGNAFITCFYYNDGSVQGWYDSDYNDVTNKPLVYADAFYVRRIAGAPVNLVISGEVKLSDTVLTVSNGNTFVGSINPVGTTLGNSGLKDSLVADTGVPGAVFDKVLIQQPNGAYITYNYYNDGSVQGWYDTDYNDATNVPLSSGVVIQSATPSAKNVKIKIPSTYPAP